MSDLPGDRIDRRAMTRRDFLWLVSASAAGAAREYARYLRQIQQGDEARYACQRLAQWGYLKR